MSKLLIAVLALFGATIPVFAVADSGKECTDCDTFRKGVNRKVVPVDDLVCIYFVQPAVDDVLLRIDLKNGQTRKYTKKAAGVSGKFCVWRGWVKQASTMYVCDTDNHADYLPQHVAVVAEKSKDSREAEACLFGKDTCAKMGYKTR